MGKGKNKKGNRKNNRTGDNYGNFSDVDKIEKYDDKGMRYPTSVITVSNGNRNKNESYHPTQKPVDLVRYLIKTYSNEGGVVFDGYSGSGSTAIACLKEKRSFIGCEIDSDYYNASLDRIRIVMSQLTLF